MPEIEIHIKGSIDPAWSDLFEDFSLQAFSADETVLSGWVVDKAAVYGVLSGLNSLGLTLISVQCHDIEGETS